MWQAIKNSYHLLKAIFFALFYFFPARKITTIGVTGTDGKTTTVNLIYEILKRAGEKVSMVSSVKAVIGQKEYETGLHVTTPDSRDVQKFLRKAVESDSKYFVLEASSHGLSQNRLWGCFFKIGVVTNITHDHLDYHKTYENYLKAKAKLFDRVKLGVLNKDDQSYKYLEAKLKNQKSKIITYGIKNKADFTPKTFPFKTQLLGDYNQYNYLAAAAVASFLKISPQLTRETLLHFTGVKGRLEEVKNKFGFRVFIDFASTPNSLKNVLLTLKKILPSSGRLIVIFGSAGLRDIQKRGLMGEISAKYADFSILTAEDPRTEDVNKIIEQIAQGCFKGGAEEVLVKKFNSSAYKSNRKYFFRIPDRKEAIKFAIQKLAKKGDIIVTCGKGHEKSMCYGKIEKPWDEYQVVCQALKTRK